MGVELNVFEDMRYGHAFFPDAAGHAMQSGHPFGLPGPSADCSLTSGTRYFVRPFRGAMGRESDGAGLKLFGHLDADQCVVGAVPKAQQAVLPSGLNRSVSGPGANRPRCCPETGEPVQ